MRRSRNRFVLDPAGAAAVAAHVQELRRRELGPATLRMRRETVRRFAEFVHPLPLLDAGRVDVERWVDDVLERGRPAGTRATYTGQLREFFRWAIRRGLVDADPTVEVSSPRVVAGVPHPISEADLSRALAAADPLTRVWLLLGGSVACGRAEIARLHREHVRADVSVPRSMSSTARAGATGWCRCRAWSATPCGRGWPAPAAGCGSTG